MRRRGRFTMRARILINTAALALVPLALIGGLAIDTNAQGPQPVQKVDMGDYEPVVPWPLPLPDTDHSHEGWTWGSGAGVWAESPDRVWVAQRGEIELPPGAAPWTCACALQPRRTNTG